MGRSVHVPRRSARSTVAVRSNFANSSIHYAAGCVRLAKGSNHRLLPSGRRQRAEVSCERWKPMVKASRHPHAPAARQDIVPARGDHHCLSKPLAAERSVDILLTRADGRRPRGPRALRSRQTAPSTSMGRRAPRSRGGRPVDILVYVELSARGRPLDRHPSVHRAPARGGPLRRQPVIVRTPCRREPLGGHPRAGGASRSWRTARSICP